MKDLKRDKKRRNKPNRPHRPKPPRDWRRIFQRALRVAATGFTAGLVVIGAALTAQVLLDSGYFNVRAVHVENAVRVTAEEIVELSDIRAGTSIFDLDLGMIGRKIEENPWIARADVVRQFPGEVVIRLTEREPRAIINLGYLYYVDAGGTIFKVLGGGDSLDYPVLSGVDRGRLLDDPEAAQQRVEGAMRLVAELASREVFTLGEVSEIHWDADEGYVLFTAEGAIPIRLGEEGFRRKLDNLEQIYGRLRQRLPALKGIDLNITDRVIVRVDQRSGMARG